MQSQSLALTIQTTMDWQAITIQTANFKLIQIQFALMNTITNVIRFN